MSKIKLLVIEIDSDGDFSWDSTSYKRDLDEFGYKKDYIEVYFDNPTNEDLCRVLKKFVEEFKESFSSHRGLTDVRDSICSSILEYLENNFYYDMIYENGNYSAFIRLKELTSTEVVFENTGKVSNITSFDRERRGTLYYP